MPAWIHGRAEHILAKNPSMPKGEAFAIATQQAHAVGKSPKSYGTLEGRETAKAKYDTPKDDKKTANPGGLESPKMEKKGEEKEENKPHNLKKYLIGSGTAVGSQLGSAALGSVAQTHAHEGVNLHGSPELYERLKEEATVPVLENELGMGGSVFAAKGKHLGPVRHMFIGSRSDLPEGPQVHVGLKNPAVLAHELGHADIHHHPVGRFFQNPVTISSAGLSPLGGAAAGFASGLGTDDKRVQHAAIAAPALMSLPNLGYEAAASINAIRKMRGMGASGGQISNAVKSLLPAWGTYAGRVAAGTGGALQTQAIGNAIRHRHDGSRSTKREKHASQVSQEKDSGFLDTIKNTLTTPIPGTPELLGGTKSGIQQATRFGGRGKGPSEGFKAFQEKRSAIDPVMFHAFADEIRKIAGATITVAPAAVPGPSPTAKQPTRAEAPPLPPLPTGLNVMFAPKPRGAVGNSVPG